MLIMCSSLTAFTVIIAFNSVALSYLQAQWACEDLQDLLPCCLSGYAQRYLAVKAPCVESKCRHEKRT
jgi:hypothetical protein